MGEEAQAREVPVSSKATADGLACTHVARPEPPGQPNADPVTVNMAGEEAQAHQSRAVPSETTSQNGLPSPTLVKPKPHIDNSTLDPDPIEPVPPEAPGGVGSQAGYSFQSISCLPPRP